MSYVAKQPQRSPERTRGSLLPSRLITRRKLTDNVADTIRDMILIGELPPSKRFTQQELADTVGVSTMPIREALLRLSHEGLITANPNRSYEVTPTTRRDITDIYWIYAALSGELAARAALNVDPALLAELKRIKDALLEISPDQVSEIEAANWEFHRLINHAAQAPRLMHMLRSTLRLIPEHFYVLLPNWARVSIHGHNQILLALKNGDSEGARAAATAHVHETGDIIIAHFSDLGFWRQPTSPDAAGEVTQKRRQSDRVAAGRSDIKTRGMRSPSLVSKRKRATAREQTITKRPSNRPTVSSAR